MRARFAPAAVVAVLLATATAPAFDREPIQPGDSAAGNILVTYTLDEFPVRVALGSTLSFSISAIGGFHPLMGLYSDDYAPVPLTGTGPTNLRSASPLASGQYRIIVGGRGASVGAYRLKTSVSPGRLFAVAGTGASTAPTLTFGAYDGFEATISLKWKRGTGVTIRSVTGPDGAPVTSGAAPIVTPSSSSQRGYFAHAVGDHVVQLDVSPGTLKWSATVRVAGRLPPGTSHDYRTTGLPDPPTVQFFPSVGAHFPIVAVVDETGGPNDCGLSSSGSEPDGAFTDGGRGFRSPRDAGSPHTVYLIYRNDGFFAEIVNVVRTPDGRVASYETPSIRTPQGSGSSSLSDFAYDAAGRPTGWTETRRFDGSGRAHTLVFSRAEYFAGNAICKAFRVVHTPPDGLPRTYDFAPF